MKKLIALALSLTMVFSLLTGCKTEPSTNGNNSNPNNNQNSSKEKVLIVRTNGNPQTFHPSMTADDFAYPIVQNIFNRLVKLDASKSTPIPDAAKEWKISDDGMKITFYLQENMKWHDGKPLTADDVVYTFTTIKNNPGYFLSPNLTDVESITKVDDYTVDFNMSSPNVALIGYLGWYGCFILPKHIYDNGQDWADNPANANPIGSGPFKFSEFKPDVSVTLVKNPDYWEAEPKMDKVVFQIIPDTATAMQALLNGDIDILGTLPDAEYPAAKNNPELTLKPNIYPSPVYIAFNMSKPIANDQAFRTAFAMCIDRESIAQKVFGGIRNPEYALYPSISWASNQKETAPKYDIAGAVKVLEDAGYKKDANGFYISGLVIDCFEGGGSPDIAKLIQADLAKAGIELVLNIQEFNAWNQKVFIEHNFVVEMQGGFQGPDPAALESRVGTTGTMNQSEYSNKRIDELFALAKKTGDQGERAKQYQEIQAILAKELPILPIVDYTSYDARRSNVINAPIDGTGKWGWNEFTFTDFK